MKRRCVCSNCGRTLRAAIEVRILFHDCPDPYTRRARRTTVDRIPEPVGITLEEVWYDAFATAVGEEPLLRRVE